LFVQPGRRTLSKNRVIAGDHMLVRFDIGSTDDMDAATEAKFIERLRELFPTCDAVIVSDYAYGILTPRVIQALANLQARSPRLLIVDSKNLPRYFEIGVTAIKPNYREAVKLLGIQELQGTNSRAEQMMQHGQQILELSNAKIAAVTLDSEGALIFDRDGNPYRTYAQPSSNARAAGAGDTFISTLTLALAAGAATPAAAELASAAAALVVQKEGTATCSAQELRGYVASADKYMTDLARLSARVEYYRQQGKCIVFTNGCFDILHSGHIGFLNRAKELGDILIVAVNTDASARRLKGPERPINPLDDRVQVLAALSCIDHIIPFEQDIPVQLIRALRPDVYVKGGDYAREDLPERAVVEEQGGRVEILPYLPEHSTTNLIERIRETNGAPSNGAVKSNGKTNGNGHGAPISYKTTRALDCAW
ncbi:MAG TPA: D-glycero-beta-D-manno-heptose 1-phosphate adenylyltransferase, partial [Anaerolineae bacterium]|nr:D-glycero-beta-D-manno-heptose 1-phosphate adenylyltransferase [Anaerolineae bacterium]